VKLVFIARERIRAAGGQLTSPPLYFGAYLDLPPKPMRVERVRTELGIDQIRVVAHPDELLADLIFREHGYKVTVVLAELDAEEAAARAVYRAFETNRFVAPEMILAVGDAPQRTFDLVKARPEIEGRYARVDSKRFGKVTDRLLEVGAGFDLNAVTAAEAAGGIAGTVGVPSRFGSGLATPGTRRRVAGHVDAIGAHGGPDGPGSVIDPRGAPAGPALPAAGGGVAAAAPAGSPAVAGRDAEVVFPSGRRI
jgi:hypothetical protein